jgi:hypothetical protein
MDLHKSSKKTTTTDERKAPKVCWRPEGHHPSQVSGIFKDDPTFEEFRDILCRQRAEDYQQAHEDLDAMMRREKEAKRCSSSTPTP